MFLFGFGKNERDNIEDSELKDLQLIARQWFDDARKLEKDLAAGNLIEVKNHDDET